MKNIVTKIRHLPVAIYHGVRHLPHVLRSMIEFIPFFFLLGVLLIVQPFQRLGRCKCLLPVSKRVGGPATRMYERVLRLLNRQPAGGMTQEDLVLLAMSHLKVKKARSIITIGGMAIGFGAVIFLLSLGYGFQRLVVSRVATLGEMKQIDVTTGQASSLTFNSKIIDSFAQMEPVDEVLPVISTVSKVSFNNSVSDIVAYGVTTRFLEESAIKPTSGSIFADEVYVSDATDENSLSDSGDQTGAVAGAALELLDGAAMGKELHQIRYAIFPVIWKPVYESPSVDAKIIGYTKRISGEVPAREVWGSMYEHAETSLSGTDEERNIYQTWVSDAFPLWRKEACSLDNFDCVDREYLIDRGPSGQTQRAGYITQEKVAINRYAVAFLGASELAEGSTVEAITFSLPSTEWTSYYTQPREDAVSQEFFTKTETTSVKVTGSLVLGEYYYDTDQWGYAGENRNGKKLGYWVKASLPIWRKLDCGTDCEYYLTQQDDTNKQEIRVVYLRAVDVRIADMEKPPVQGSGLRLTGRVLGDSTEVAGDASASASTGATTGSTSGIAALASASAARTASGSAALSASASAALGSIDLAALGITGPTAGLGELDWALIASQAGIASVKQSKDVFPLPAGARKVALVNTAMLTLLGLQPNDAIGKEFGTTFLLDGKLFNKENYSAESEQTTYKIIGILPDDRTPAFYVPLGDIKGLGIENYTQLKIIADNTSLIGKIRQEAESKGFRTASVVDTIDSINQLFNYLRMGLLALGLIALGVAALGMFNTLTVSLLEKTREVGLMKAMGMKSREVQRLFIAESVIMGVSGGAFGLLFGYVAGKIVSVVLSSISLASGAGALDIAYIPLTLTLIIMGFSFVVGVATGWYPAYRATQVSALNALRYE